MKLPLAPERYDRTDQDRLRNAFEIELMRLQFHREPRRVLFYAGELTTTSTSEISLASYTVTGGTLGTDGHRLRITIHGNQLVQAGQFRLLFGAFVVDTTVTTLQTEFSLWADIWRANGPNVQTSRKLRVITGFTGNVGGAGGTENTDTDVLLDFRGSVTAGGTMNIKGLWVEWLGVDTPV